MTPARRNRHGRSAAGRRWLRGAVLGFVTAVAALAAAARGAGEPLTLHAAAERVLAQYPSVQAAAARNDGAQKSIGVAKAEWFPSLALSATATRYEEPMLVYPIHGFTPSLVPPFARTLYHATLELGYTLFDGARSGRVREARARAGAAGANAGATAQELLQSVVFSYLQVLGRRELLAAHDRRLEALRAERTRVDHLLATGRAADVDRLQADAEVQRAEADRVERAALLTLAEQELARLIDLPVEATQASELVPVVLADSLLAPQDSLTAAAEAHHPRLRQARALAEASRAAAATARGERWPDLGIFARENYWTDDGGNEALEWSAGVQLEYPLFTGGARRAAIGAAGAEAQASSADAELAALEIGRGLDQARSDVEEARARGASLDIAVRRFAEVVRIRKLTLETGTGTQLDYLDAEADLLDAQARLIDARHREIVARSELALHTGQLDLEWLRRNLENRP